MDMRDRRAAILEIQQSLRILYKAGFDIPQINPDGVFGDKTEEAVRAYQRINDLEQTGIVNYELWTMLVEESNIYLK